MEIPETALGGNPGMSLLRASTLVVAIIGLYAPSSATAEGLSGTSIAIGTPCGVATTSPVTCTANGKTLNAQAEGNLTTMRLSMDYSAVNDLGFPGCSGNVMCASFGGGVRIFDSITITGGPFGSPGILRVNWAVTGTLAASGTGDWTVAEIDYIGPAVAEWRVCGLYEGSCGSSTAKGSPVNETVSTVIPFVFGTPLNSFSFALIGGTSGGALNFFNTAQLQPLVVMDSSGNQVLGAQVLGDSGFSYPIAPTAADLSVTQSDLPDPVMRGDNITYTVMVKNNGPSAANEVSLSDVVPSDAKFVSNSGAPGWSCTNPPTKGARTGAITCTTAGLASGASATFTIVVEVNAGTKATTIANTAVVTSSTDDPNTGNNTATATTTVKAHK